MSLRAKCRHCDWKVRAEGSVYLHLAVAAHRAGTGHKIKIKHS